MKSTNKYLGGFGATILLLVLALTPNLAQCAPRMISQDYPNCTSCHINPMGAGILTDYGTIVDEAQSLRGGLFDPESRSKFIRYVDDKKSSIQDLRGVATTKDEDALSLVRYANSLSYGKHSVYQETFQSNQSDGPDHTYTDKAWYQYTLDKDDTSGTTFVAGEDYQPSGLGNGVYQTIAKFGGDTVVSNQSNLQMKGLYWSENILFSPLVFIPGKSLTSKADTQGVGALLEHPIRSNFVVGGKISYFKLTDVESDPELANYSLHTRFGLSKETAVLMQGSFTSANQSDASISQTSGVIQIFHQIEEWLVPGIGYSGFKDPSSDDTITQVFRAEIGARLSRNFSINLATEYDPDRSDKNKFIFQIAGKI